MYSVKLDFFPVTSADMLRDSASSAKKQKRESITAESPQSSSSIPFSPTSSIQSGVSAQDSMSDPSSTSSLFSIPDDLFLDAIQFKLPLSRSNSITLTAERYSAEEICIYLQGRLLSNQNLPIECILENGECLLKTKADELGLRMPYSSQKWYNIENQLKNSAIQESLALGLQTADNFSFTPPAPLGRATSPTFSFSEKLPPCDASDLTEFPLPDDDPFGNPFLAPNSTSSAASPPLPSPFSLFSPSYSAEPPEIAAPAEEEFNVDRFLNFN